MVLQKYKCSIESIVFYKIRQFLQKGFLIITRIINSPYIPPLFFKPIIKDQLFSLVREILVNRTVPLYNSCDDFRNT